uniref:Uncharacterized protein n=1 Tax=Dictyoglomus turgidum TaxID=513050 RepID=A0A7C3SQZ6_9BACT
MKKQKVRKVRFNGKLIPINDVIPTMFYLNTGMYFLDSGGFPHYNKKGEYIGSIQGYGRAYEQPRNEKDVLYQDEDGYWYINTWKHLNEILEFDPKWNNDFYRFAKTMPEDPWPRVMEAWSGNSVVNTYNFDNLLDRVIQYTMKKVKEGKKEKVIVALQSHNGCDVRGGYTDPYVFNTFQDDVGEAEFDLLGMGYETELEEIEEMRKTGEMK